MILRQLLMNWDTARPAAFRLRGTSVSRMECFSDCVFGVAVTLLVVSLDMPQTYEQLVVTLRNTPAFAVCFVALIVVWSAQYRFFRRYGLEDRLTVAINAALLFVVLVYIYPLKFLLTLLTDLTLGIDDTVLLANGTRAEPITAAQWPGLMRIYAAGFVACFGCLLLLYLNAWRQRGRLALTPSELLDTRAALLEQVVTIGVGIMAFACAAWGSATLACLSFALRWPLTWLIDASVARRRRVVARRTDRPLEQHSAAEPS